MSEQTQHIQKEAKSRKLPREQVSNNHLEQQMPILDVSHRLQDALRLGTSVATVYWNFHVGDWITNIQGADIDNDGDVEILVSSRDGWVYALTHWGALKWKTGFKRQYISALCAVPLSDVELVQVNSTIPRIIVGMRNGNVIALNEKGVQIPNWEYTTKRMIRQISISPQTPERVIIASEDRCVHILDTRTGQPVCESFRTNGWVRAIVVCDIDGDGQEEILAGSGDKCLYILDYQGRCLDKFPTGFQIYTLFATRLEPEGPIQVIISSNRKDLLVWTITRRSEKRWGHKKEWEIQERDGIFQNRLHSICVADLNQDGLPEILLGSEDSHLYILDHRGSLLWKHFFGSCVYSIYTADINFDGQIEVLVGTEDYGAFSLHLNLKGNPYQQIRQCYEIARTSEEAKGDLEIFEEISPKERSILREFVQDTAPEHHIQMEMADAINLMEKRFYEKALALFLRLRRQTVQYYWAQPFKVKGYIWTLSFGSITPDHKDDIIVGTDEGYIYAVDTEKDRDKQLWMVDVGDRVRMLQTGSIVPDALDMIFAVLANHHLIVLDYKGEVVKEHTFKNKQDWADDIYLHKQEDNHNLVQEIVIGLENKKVSIWDAQLQKEQQTIDMPQGIHSVYRHDITGSGSADIIGGSLEDHVYVYNRAGKEIWNFRTHGRIQALHAADIDGDGHIEVIVGSEDRNVYVLDYEGHLRWRYRTLRGILDIDVCDLQLERDPANSEKHPLTLLISGADNCLYALDAEGDLIWRYYSTNRIRTVRAKDVNGDGKVEIAIASENQLELLQIINRNELINYMERCWDNLIAVEDYRAKIMELTHHPDEYIRAYALAKLAGQITRLDNDFTRLQEALHQDISLEVKRELVRAIAVLCKVPKFHGENTRQARQFLQALVRAPEQEIRMEIVRLLPFISEYEVGLCFEYLEYFIHSVDRWVRRSVVRQLDQLVEKYPDRVFRLLQKTVDDEKDWIKLESARVLARYFDIHPQNLISGMLLLVDQRVELFVLKQISYSSRIPAIKQFFTNIAYLLQDLNSETIVGALDKAIISIKGVRDLNLLNEEQQIEYSEELLQVYEEFLQLFGAKTIDAIAHLQWITRPDVIDAIPYQNISFIVHAFEALHEVVNTIKAYERRSTQDDRASSLFTANDTIDRARNQLQEEEIRQMREHTSIYRLPEYTILSLLLEQWSKVIKMTLYRLRGNAKLIADIQNQIVRPEEEITISVLIHNEGHSPADNLCIHLDDGDGFDIIGSNVRSLQEVSSSKPAEVTFIIKPHEEILHSRLSFQITFDDAEKRGKHYAFANSIAIEEHQRPYREIPNHYNSGTPIRDEEMFYGRIEDLALLREKLKSLKANKVVVLSGQRRMGKTSLIYQLAHQLKESLDIPVLIDLQSFSLVTNVGQLLYKIAECTQKEVVKYRGIAITLPDELTFLNNPTAAFDHFLHDVLKRISSYKLVFLLDEFEKLQEHIDKKILDEKILHYLRSLMQHRDRLNFLLVSAPSIRYLTEPYWAVFFNIALQHRLSKLKEAEAIDLIVKPVQGYLEYDHLALRRVRQLSGDQPYLIHVICEQLIQYCNKLQKTYVTVNDVNIVLKRILEEQTTSIYWIWHQFASPTEHLLLSILAQEQDEEERFLSLNSIRTEYDNQGVLFEKREVMRALEKLVKEDILEEQLDGAQFRIPVGLFREWLRKDKPPERVVREEPLAGDE